MIPVKGEILSQWDISVMFLKLVITYGDAHYTTLATFNLKKLKEFAVLQLKVDDVALPQRLVIDTLTFELSLSCNGARLWTNESCGCNTTAVNGLVTLDRFRPSPAKDDTGQGPSTITPALPSIIKGGNLIQGYMSVSDSLAWIANLPVS